jgi:hypothetical protein
VLCWWCCSAWHHGSKEGRAPDHLPQPEAEPEPEPAVVAVRGEEVAALEEEAPAGEAAPLEGAAVEAVTYQGPEAVTFRRPTAERAGVHRGRTDVAPRVSRVAASSGFPLSLPRSWPRRSFGGSEF